MPAQCRLAYVDRSRVPMSAGLSAKTVQSRPYRPRFEQDISEKWSLGPMFAPHDLLLLWRPRPLQYTFSLTVHKRAKSVSFQTRTATPSIICNFGALTVPVEIHACSVAREIPAALAATRVVTLFIYGSIV